ncbi:hypothetical protein ACWKSP_14925 [Micromonosporaceae bacterium Da 78-11]
MREWQRVAVGVDLEGREPAVGQEQDQAAQVLPVGIQDSALDRDGTGCLGGG